MHTRKSSIVPAKRQRETEQGSTSTISPPHTRARVSEPDFNFKRYCLFCGDEANEEAEKKKAQNVHPTVISKELLLDSEMDENLTNTIELVTNKTISCNDIEEGDEIAEALLDQFNEKLQEHGERGPTAKLWIQYFHMVSIAKEFIRAKRMGDWRPHLNCVKEMLPYLHASGHFITRYDAIRELDGS
ncbi:unnamed protein product [Parnassius apollo]|uniref:(apollo) hypothetical protein n=1 Tax=Parnassius apollo TaxID=110799 RepID=A0A8S3WRK0_PARAO|nr:unnamed protein product [Parnassius apollo]